MEFSPEQTVEGLAIVRVLAAVLERLVSANAHLALNEPAQVTKFQALKAPGISIVQYLERVHKYASCSNECFILALIYIDRLIQRNGFLLTELNVHRVVITAVLLAAKFFDDAYYNNAYYAKVGGVLTSEMNGLEVDFLFRINFSLHVTPDVFEKYRVELISHSMAASLIPQPELQPSPVHIQAHQMVQQHTPYYGAEGVCAYPGEVNSGTSEVVPSLNNKAQNNFQESHETMDDIIPVDSNIEYYFPPSGMEYIHRGNTLPVQESHSNAPSSHYGAPSVTGQPPVQPPVNVEANDQYVVVDNQIFHLQTLQRNHGAEAAEILIRGAVHGNFHQHKGTSTYIPRDGNHFVTGQMLAPVSGGP